MTEIKKIDPVKALTNLHNRAMAAPGAQKTKIIRQTKALNELVQRNRIVEIENSMCPMCGNDVNDGDRFCSWCGQRIGE